jgi:hypothetical protein
VSKSAARGSIAVAGEVSGLLMAAIRLALREPSRTSDWMPYALQFGELDNVEHAALTVAEIADLRWREVERAAPSFGAKLSTHLQALGYAAIAFDPDGRQLVVVASCLAQESISAELALRLAGRVYLVPFRTWSPLTAEAIYSDVLAERAAGFPLEGFTHCAERAALLSITEERERYLDAQELG